MAEEDCFILPATSLPTRTSIPTYQFYRFQVPGPACPTHPAFPFPQFPEPLACCIAACCLPTLPAPTLPGRKEEQEAGDGEGGGGGGRRQEAGMCVWYCCSEDMCVRRIYAVGMPVMGRIMVCVCVCKLICVNEICGRRGTLCAHPTYLTLFYPTFLPPPFYMIPATLIHSPPRCPHRTFTMPEELLPHDHHPTCPTHTYSLPTKASPSQFPGLEK